MVSSFFLFSWWKILGNLLSSPFEIFWKKEFFSNRKKKKDFFANFAEICKATQQSICWLSSLGLLIIFPNQTMPCTKYWKMLTQTTPKKKEKKIFIVSSLVKVTIMTFYSSSSSSSSRRGGHSIKHKKKTTKEICR